MSKSDESTNSAHIWVIALALVFGGLAGGYWFLQMQERPSDRQAPQYALQQVRKAVEARNPLLFDRYVELERFTQAFVGALFTHATSDALSDADAGSTGGETVGSLLGVSLTEQYKPVASSLLESAIRRAVETGQADSVLKSASAGDSIEAETLLRPAGVEPSGFRGVTDIQQVEGLATFGLRFYNSDLDTTVVFKVQMEERDDGWVITEPYNLTRLLQDIEERRRVVVARQRAQIKKLAKKRVEKLKRAYAPLLTALNILVEAGERWGETLNRVYRAKSDSLENELYDPFKVEQDDSIRADKYRVARQLRRGPTESELQAEITGDREALDSVTWGLAGRTSEAKTILWVRQEEAGTSAECAVVFSPIEYAGPIPDRFEWIESESGPTCRGKGLYVQGSAYARALQHVRESRDWLIE